MQNEMTKAEASAKAAQSDVVTAQHSLARAKAAYELADLSFTRIQEVSKKEPGLVPQQDVDVAHSRQLEAAAQLSTEQSSLESAEERSSVAKAEQDRLKTMYRYTNITAPVCGNHHEALREHGFHDSGRHVVADASDAACSAGAGLTSFD